MRVISVVILVISMLCFYGECQHHGSHRAQELFPFTGRSLLQRRSCASFCGMGSDGCPRPCTTPCQNWGCSNCPSTPCSPPSAAPTAVPTSAPSAAPTVEPNLCPDVTVLGLGFTVRNSYDRSVVLSSPGDADSHTNSCTYSHPDSCTHGELLCRCFFSVPFTPSLLEWLTSSYK